MTCPECGYPRLPPRTEKCWRLNLAEKCRREVTVEIMQVAENILTPKQFVAYKLNSNGMSERDIAIYLKISRRAVRDRLAEADVKIHRYLEAA